MKLQKVTETEDNHKDIHSIVNYLSLSWNRCQIELRICFCLKCVKVLQFLISKL